MACSPDGLRRLGSRHDSGMAPCGGLHENVRHELDKLATCNHRYYLKMAASFGVHWDVAQDAVQSAYARAYDRVHQLRDESSIHAWLTTILANECRQILRDRQRTITSGVLTGGDGVPDVANTSDSCLPNHGISREGLQTIVRMEACRLPAVLKEVFDRRAIRDLSMEAIASELRISVPAVKSRLYRARMEMRRRVAKFVGRRGPVSLLDCS